MKRYIKIVILIAAVPILLQVICYNLFGQRAIHLACMKNLKSLAFSKDSVGIYSPYIDLSDDEKDEIKNALRPKNIDFTSNAGQFSKRFRHNENGYGMGYQIEKLNWFVAEITEHNGTLYYGEVWESKYVWVLFTWVQVKQENIGQS